MPEIIYKTAYLPDSGTLLWVSYGPEETIVFPEDQGFSWVEGNWDKETHYVVNGIATPRPATDLPATHSLAVNTDWSLPSVPVGTVVLIEGEEAGVVDETGLVLNFELSGIWKVDLKPPFPWVDASCEVTVA
ncbi:MAG: hypothetical protein LPK02_07610 [Rhodobacterales bacterium]|mgnify:CR=1 FL=1|nr:hypothetical protein [Rhodobacterales bacterium]